MPPASIHYRLNGRRFATHRGRPPSKLGQIKELFHDYEIVGKSGSISVTEYVFRCPTCDTTVTFNEQEDIAVKQKNAGSHIL